MHLAAIPVELPNGGNLVKNAEGRKHPPPGRRQFHSPPLDVTTRLNELPVRVHYVLTRGRRVTG